MPDEDHSYIDAFDRTVNRLDGRTLFTPESDEDLCEQTEHDASCPRSRDRLAPFALMPAMSRSVPERYGRAIDEFEDAVRLDRVLLTRTQDERPGTAPG